MGCTSPLVVRDGKKVCDCTFSSVLVDGVSPNINTSDNDWAAQLVTVRRNMEMFRIDFDHVLLTFGFDTAVSLTRIEIDLFHCPDLGIGAPTINIHYNPEYNLTFSISLPGFAQVLITDPNCTSLFTAVILPQGQVFHILHILVDFDSKPIDWVYVGEVKFLGHNDKG